MTREEIMLKVQEIFREVFDDEEIILTEETSSADLEEWDSIEHINIVLQLEQSFGIKIDMGEVVTLNTLGNIVNVIENKLA